MRLPNSKILTAFPTVSDGLTPKKHLAALSILEDYADLFSTWPMALGCSKALNIKIDLEDIRPL